ncbi:MAG: glycosyl hydrolase [Betaproteobacteria bacterium]|nr:glycosyl hydrolase [Betaproteobacteria bacterium]
MQKAKQPNRTTVLVGTRKGLFILHGDGKRAKWRVDGEMPHFHGQIVNHAVMNPRTGTILVAARAGHLGPTVFRSTDSGKSWKEASSPPAFPKRENGGYGWTVNHVFWLTPGHASEPRVWYAGTSPHGLFRSDDDGVTWSSVDGFNLHPDRLQWLGEEDHAVPDGALLHSVNVDPFDAKHLMIGMSSGGVFESFDRGATWKALNRGCVADFLPDPDAEWGHDPHCMVMHPAVPDVVYQQNHCGIYKLKRAENRWTRIGENMPKEIGDIGFPVTLHPRDPNTLWVFPMDGTSVWPRMSVAGKPAVYCSRDGGASWKRQAKGLPAGQAWFTVKRQAMSADQAEKVGLYFGTTSGEVWCSFDEGGQWHCLMLHLPHIYSVEAYSL